MGRSVGILGAGAVGLTLARGFSDIGYEVVIGSRDGHKVENWDGRVGTYSEVAKLNTLLVLCVKGEVAKEVVELIKDYVDGKTIIDTTNPIAKMPPDNGVLHYFTSLDKSLMEVLQETAPDANFVKCFNSIGHGLMINPDFKGIKPTMFICGNDESSKKAVREILTSFGWETADFGLATSARTIEPLCILWCIPSFLEGKRNHAFKLLE